MPNLLEGLLRGYMTGKEQQRQSFMDQMDEQYRKARLDLDRAEQGRREKEFKFGVLERQKQDYEKSLGLQDLMLSLTGQQQFYQQPEETMQDLGQVPTSLISQLSGVFEGQPQFQTQPLVQPIPGARQEREQKGRLVESQIAENLRQAKQPAGGQPKLPTQAVLDAQYMQDLMKEGMTRKQAYEELQKMKRNQSLDAYIDSILGEGTPSAFTPPPGWDQLTPQEQAEYKKLKGIQ